MEPPPRSNDRPRQSALAPRRWVFEPERLAFAHHRRSARLRPQIDLSESRHYALGRAGRERAQAQGASLATRSRHGRFAQRHRSRDLRLPPLGRGSGKQVIPTMASRSNPARGTSRRSEALPPLSPGRGPRIGSSSGIGQILLCAAPAAPRACSSSREGVALNIIQRQLGHANLGSTSIYLGDRSTPSRSSRPCARAARR
jgi:hypothetical protein